MDNVLLLETKKQYIKQIKYLLIPCLYDGIYSLYIDSKKTYLKNIDEYKKKNYGILTIFQIYLKNIIKWNNNLIDTECKRIEISSKCNYYDKIIEAIIKSHANIMIYGGNNNNIKIEIPTKDSFIHKCYIEIAKIIYKNPYFMLEIDKSNNTTDKKIRKCKKIINEAIDECIRNVLPIEKILSTYLDKKDISTNLNTNTNTNLNTNNSTKSIIVEKYSNSDNSNTNSDYNNNYS